jgi:hypothetical protein
MVDGSDKNKTALIVGTLGALALAVAGSALWDFIFKPLVLWLADGVVTIANLGSTQLSDTMYREIAKGNYERAGVEVIGAMAGMVGAITLVSLTFAPRRELRERLKNSKLQWVFRLTAIFTFGVIALQTSRTIFVVRAASHLAQLQNIVGPYVIEDRRVQLASTIALINSKDDYLRVLEQLENIVVAQKLTPPTRP